MNFTREPIIETVITPREGCKLVVRSSKGNGQEDYHVDAVEVVSFGHSFFFRSLEKPKSFLVPVSDYEILELRETRVVLKNVSAERSIKIGGGRETPPPRQQYREPREAEQTEAQPREESTQEEQAQPAEGASFSGDRMDRGKRDRRRRGRRGGRDRNSDMRGGEQRASSDMAQPTEGSEMTEGQESGLAPESEEPKAAPSFISKLFPPPATLIKETLGRYKTTESIEQESFPAQEKQKEDKASSDHSVSSNEEPPRQSEDDSDFED